MQIKELLLGIPVLIFVLWVFSAPLPAERIERVCQPIHWVGNLAVSTTALSAEKHTETSVRWSDKLNYSCQYMVWRLFYQDEYNKALAAGLITPTGAAATPAAPIKPGTPAATPSRAVTSPAGAPADQPTGAINPAGTPSTEPVAEKGAQ